MSTALKTTETQAFPTPPNISELLWVFEYSVRHWIKMGDLPAGKVGRGWHIQRAAVVERLGRHQVASFSQP